MPLYLAGESTRLMDRGSIMKKLWLKSKARAISSQSTHSSTARDLGVPPLIEELLTFDDHCGSRVSFLQRWPCSNRWWPVSMGIQNRHH